MDSLPTYFETRVGRCMVPFTPVCWTQYLVSSCSGIKGVLTGVCSHTQNLALINSNTVYEEFIYGHKIVIAIHCFAIEFYATLHLIVSANKGEILLSITAHTHGK